MPIISKIIIFLIILQAFISFIFYYSDNPKSLGITFNPPCKNSGNAFVSSCMPPREVTIGSVLTYALDYFFYRVRMGSISYPILIAGLIISYLISCMIVFSYSKIRKLMGV